MQLNKDKKSLSEINSYCRNSSLLIGTFNQLLGLFDLRYINKLLSDTKKRGVPSSKVFRTLFVLRLLDFDNIYQLMQSGLSKEVMHKKDVLYDFLKNSHIPWRRILRLFFKQTHALILDRCTEADSDSPRCFVLDDSLLEKSGKTMEFIGKVFDHCTYTYQLGMKVLTLGYCGGKSFMPLDFSIHNEPGRNNRRGLKKKELENQFSKEREPGSAGYQRVLDVSQDKISTALQMIKRYKKNWLKVDYVLADSWFICERFLRGVHAIDEKLEVIGQMKTNRILNINGKSYKANQVPELKRKNIHYSKKLKCSYISLKISYKGIAMRGYWIKMKGQQNWSLLISTDDKLSFVKAMECYKNRWSIEVFFKDCKQNLGLQACQSTDLDAHIATISIVFMNYMALALKKRFEDYETLGILFRGFKDLLLQQTIIQCIWRTLIQFFDSVFAAMGMDWNLFIRTLINKQEIILQNINQIFAPLYANNQKNIA